jgi:tRNA U34 5-carboxymethylaminomethyl modifying enzyme MnmG/GidA
MSDWRERAEAIAWKARAEAAEDKAEEWRREFKRSEADRDEVRRRAEAAEARVRELEQAWVTQAEANKSKDLEIKRLQGNVTAAELSLIECDDNWLTAVGALTERAEAAEAELEIAVDWQTKLRERAEAAEAELAKMREALQMLVDEKADYMRINLLGDPEQQHTIKVARAALAIKEPRQTDYRGQVGRRNALSTRRPT